MRRLAVADLGSNSFRLVVFSYDGWWAVTDEIREPVRLSAGMGDGDELRPEPVARAEATLEVFASFCRASGIDDVLAVGTSALRRARNGPEVLARFERHLPVRVLDESEEAWYGALAILDSTTVTDGFGLDMGGGSVQLMRFAGRVPTDLRSLPLGAVRVSEAFLPGEHASRKELRALRGEVRAQLASAPWFAAPPAGARLAGLGGSVRNLAAAAEKRYGFPNGGVQGFELGCDMVSELVEELASRPASQRGEVPGIKPDRGDVILGAAVVLETLMLEGGFASVEVTEAGLREGLFFERLLAPRDPPLVDDVREASLRNLALRYGSDLDHVGHVTRLSLELYDSIVELGLHDGDDAERELLRAACMVHDVGTAVAYDDHHKHSRYLILSAGLPGFTRREIGIIALLARYHRKGEPDPGALGGLRRPGDGQLLGLLAGILRVAEQLERSRDGTVAAVRLADEDGVLCLHTEVRHEAAVALWGAGRNVGLLERAVGRPIAVAGSG